MLSRLWERAVAFFFQLLVSAFNEAERRAEIALAQRLDASAAGFGGKALNPSPDISVPSAHAIETTPTNLPQLPPIPLAPAETREAVDALPPRRPRGRPRKEQP